MTARLNLVTGATGLLGSHLAEQLIDRGEGVRALVRPGSDVAFLRSLGAELALGDLNNPASLAAAVAAWHLAMGAPIWIEQTSGTSASLRGVSAVSEDVAWLSGSNGTVLRTVDGGRTWRGLTVAAEPLDFRDIDAVDDRTACAMSIGTGPASRDC